MALYRCFHCPEECQNFPFRGYGFKDPAPAFKGEVSSGDPPQSFPGMPSYTPSPYSSPDLGVDIIKCFFRHDVSVIGSPSPDHGALVQQQGRNGQLRISFGSAKHPDCRGITVDELQKIQFNRLDFTNFYEDLMNNQKIPDSGVLTQKVKEQIADQLKQAGQ